MPFTGTGRTSPRPVVLLLPGQGSQQPGMAVGLYGHEPAFTEAMDAVFDAMGPASAGLRADWLSGHPAVPVHHVTRSTPLLFAIDYAIGQMLMRHDVRPAALLGHSIGEMAAAVLAGVFDLETAAAIVLERVDRMARTPPGGMLAVAASLAEVCDSLQWPHGVAGGDDVAIAAVNAPRQVILAGLAQPLAAVARRLRDGGLTMRRVAATTAFHSPALARLAADDRELFADLTVQPASIPVYSAYAGGLLTPRIAADPAFWASHVAAPVLFWPTLDVLLSETDAVLVESGPGQDLSTLARRHPAVTSGRCAVVPMLPARIRQPEDDMRAVRQAIERLHAEHTLASAAARV